ncbi:MAG TPA: V4R domain-containing protein [Candidatus Thermoplasmatota archaeon]|nr:V4R domain-containing protein [Candidatus Thermoplasmatota archaeon]
MDELAGFRNFILVLLALPALVWLVSRREAQAEGGPSSKEGEHHGRDYYLGFTIGRNLPAEDVDEALRLLRDEAMSFTLASDDGGEKTFVAKRLPATRTRNHDLEAGLLSGLLYRTTQTRFEVDEEHCRERGDPVCTFVAVRG